MRKVVLPVLLLALIGLFPSLLLANHPSPLPDVINTPSFNYAVNYTNDNPYDPNNIMPGDDLNYFPDALAQNVADALHNNNTAVPGTPNGYHTGYTNLGFQTPEFGGTPRNTMIFDCSQHGGCDSGNAPADRINLPAPMYITRSEPCTRLVMGHELFHHVQYAYITFGKWTQWGSMPVEGTARMMQDKIYNDLDANAGCITYRGEVNGYLGNPNQTLWNASYASALFWNYLAEQFGDVTDEPQRGVDVIEQFWSNAEASNSSPDTVAAIRKTIKDYDTDATLEKVWHDFTIANYAKDLDVSGLADALKYQYRDENDGISGSYNAVATAGTNMIPGTWTDSDSVVRWGAKYYVANVDAGDCQGGVAGFRADGDTAAYSLLAIKGTDRVDRLYKSVTDHFAHAVLLRDGDPYTKLVAVVAGLDDDVDFTYTFACGPAKLDIKLPNFTYPAYVGEPGGPADNFLIRLSVTGPTELGNPSVEGLDPSDFRAYVGDVDPANEAPIVSAAYVQGEYWLVAQAPTKAVGGTYPLTVRLGASLADTEEAAVIYEKQILDQMLVIDRSGSMLSPAAYPKLDAAKNAASLFVDAAGTDDKLGVVSFGGNNSEPNDDATLLTLLQDVTDAHRASAKGAIAGIATAPSVLTSIGDGLVKARDEFTVRGSPIGEDWIVLLSDGMENEAEYWNNVRASIQSAGIKVNTIALGPLTDQALLQSIANETGGTYYYVDLPPGSAAAAASALAAPSDLANSLADAYALAKERIYKHERLWEDRGTVPNGGTQIRTIQVDEGGIADGVFSFNWTDAGEALDVEIRRPNGTVVQDGVAGAEIQTAATHYVAHVGTIDAGTWTIELRAASGSPDWLGILSGRNEQGAALEIYFSQQDGDAYLQNQNGIFMRGLPMTILASLTDQKGPVLGADVVATVEHPDGTTIDLPLLDDGNHGDGNANDGIYGNKYTRTTAYSLSAQGDTGTYSERGSYNVRVEAGGKDNLGGAFQRIRKGSFQIFEGPGREQKDPDPDKDDMPTRYEALHPCLDPDTYDADKDGDEDGISNIEEYKAGTDPCYPDTDRGGESDASEAERGANPFDPRDDALPKPIDVEVVDWVLDHVPGLVLKPQANLIRYPVNPAYYKIRLLRSTNPTGPFSEVATFDAKAYDGLYYDEGLTNNTTYYYRLQGVDLNGNTSAPSHIFSGTPKANPYPPIGHVLINDDKPYTTSANVTLTLSATVGTTHVQIANSTTLLDSAPWQPFSETKAWTLAPNPSTGYAAVYVRYRDGSGNVSTIYFDEIRVKPQLSLGSIIGVVKLAKLPKWRGILILARPIELPDLTAAANAAAGEVTNEVVPVYTDENGNFTLDGLLPGTYELLVEYPGHRKQIIKNVTVTAGGETDIGEVTLNEIKLYLPVIKR